MRTRQRQKRRIGGLVVPVIASAILTYFALHVHTGQYGLEAKGEFSAELQRRTEELARVTRERERIERRVALLHDGSLERDMIDERARRYLNVGTEDEIVILR